MSLMSSKHFPVLRRSAASVAVIAAAALVITLLPVMDGRTETVWGPHESFRDPGALRQEDHVLLDQNWNEHDRQWFYHRNQGSRLLPYLFFLHLEQADSPELLRDPLHMLGFGLVPGKKSVYNPDALPVGFARDRDYVGLTCAACHTQLIQYQGKFLRIDGGQAMLDLQGMLGAMQASMLATLESEDKFERFKAKVLGKHAKSAAGDRLRAALRVQYELHHQRNRSNATQAPYGHSRLDAFGAILNKGLALTGVPDNYNEPNAPTSIPYLWDTPQHDYVEWNGAQANAKIGALARNVGEVIGVFGSVDVDRPAKRLLFWDAGYSSSVDLRGLRELETKIAQLTSPLWPERFPAIREDLAMQGRRLYERYCLACHQDMQREDPQRKIQVRMSSLAYIGTDPQMARNALDMRGKSGRFAGMPRFYSAGDPLGEEAPALHIVNVVMGAVLYNHPLQSYLAIRDAAGLGHPDEYHPPKYLDGVIMERGQEVSEQALLAYKARPLNGIWSTAPYLHNGSVPTLYDLLLPASERPKRFAVTGWRYDPVKVGYVTWDTMSIGILIDTDLVGNSNAGHEYGTGEDGLPALDEQARWALVEYMKTL